jgi:crotonobetainyl-CoA:carnitine CoA-transferase CaiB-like acyl-CoA transferase
MASKQPTGSEIEAVKPLAGLRVVTLEHAVAAPLCSRHLADLGADVIKVERPQGGDLARSYDTVVNGQSAYFVWANRGKRSIVLDLALPDDRLTLQHLLSTADVFVHNLGPGAVTRLGFGSDDLARLNPSLVNCGISGYGPDGPYSERKAFDLLIQGEAGLLSITGEPDAPAKVGISVADMCSALYALSSILAALHQRAAVNCGSVIDITLLDCLSEWMMVPAYHQMYDNTQLPREGLRHNMFVPYGVYPVGSGENINLAVQTPEQWKSFCDIVMADPDLATDRRFSNNTLRVKNRLVLERRITERFAEFSAHDVTLLLEQAGTPFGEVRDMAGLLDHPQLAARNRWMDIEIPSGHARALKAPFNITGQPGRSQPASADGGAVPALGESGDEIRASLADDSTRWPMRPGLSGDLTQGRFGHLADSM